MEADGGTRRIYEIHVSHELGWGSAQGSLRRRGTTPCLRNGSPVSRGHIHTSRETFMIGDARNGALALASQRRRMSSGTMPSRRTKTGIQQVELGAAVPFEAILSKSSRDGAYVMKLWGLPRDEGACRR